MLHSITCIGALSAPQSQIATELINDNMLWINSWSVTPSAISLGDPVTIKYSAVDSRVYNTFKRYLVETSRHITINRANGRILGRKAFPEQLAREHLHRQHNSTAGTYYYVADMLDSAKREARAPLVTTVTVSSVSTSGYTLTVNSTNPSSGVGITVSPADNNALGNGTTNFVRTYNKNTQVTLTAPPTASGNNFSSWTNCDSATSTMCTVTLAASRTVTANYGTATLAFSPAPGTYSTTQTVTISDSAAGASIFYTTDGTTPTTSSTPYNGPITVSATETIEAIASVSGNSIGAVATAAYTIAAPVVNITGEWNWVGGSNIAGAASVPGTLGVAAPGNVPGARMHATSWTDGSGNLWLFGGCSSNCNGGSNDLWEFSPSTNEWTLVNGGGQTVYGTKGVPAAANVPPGRWGASSWIDSSGKLWLFGGHDFFDTDDNDFYFNDLWNYNPATKEWTWVNGTNSWQDYGVTGTQGIPDPANVPSGRYGAVSWIDSSGNLWLFGGFGNANGWYVPFNDLWRYTPATNEWTWMNGYGDAESDVYGTKGVPSASNIPGSRMGAASWTDSSGNFWLFGGWRGWCCSGYQASLNNLWEFNPSTRCMNLGERSKNS